MTKRKLCTNTCTKIWIRNKPHWLFKVRPYPSGRVKVRRNCWNRGDRLRKISKKSRYLEKRNQSKILTKDKSGNCYQTNECGYKHHLAESTKGVNCRSLPSVTGCFFASFSVQQFRMYSVVKKKFKGEFGNRGHLKKN